MHERALAMTNPQQNSHQTQLNLTFNIFQILYLIFSQAGSCIMRILNIQTKLMNSVVSTMQHLAAIEPE